MEKNKETSFEEYLKTHGSLVYTNKGTSMLPMLRQGRDVMVIRPRPEKLKKYDVVLYKVGEKYILHRVIGVGYTSEGGPAADNSSVKEQTSGKILACRILGDNNVFIETVPDSAIFGILTEFIRDGKRIPVTDKKYLMYSRLIVAVFPMRVVYRKARRKAGAILRKLGLSR